MKRWTLLMCLFSAVFSLPIPHAQHPGYINFSYEVMTPLKWYQSLIGHQYPRYGYGPMGDWMHHHAGPTLSHHSTYPSFHALPHQIHPSQQHLQPPFNTPAGNSPLGHMPGPNTMPHFLPGVPGQNPLSPHAGEHPVHHQPPGNPIQPMQPGNPSQPVYPGHPVHPMPPVIHDAPLEPWPGTDKTKQEEVVTKQYYNYFTW
uniref:amelogenin, X isoform n=1 Tax=Euleptes europaea TaxID=460621 RepID=UPI00254035E8|nr:amelogenin, X isoform [Euleptes europaea]